MILRRAALALGSLALVGTLAACDLPDGTPPQVSYDVEPNDTVEDAQAIPVPSTIRGSLDPNDTFDYYRLAAPAEDSTLYLTCTGGDVFVVISVRSGARTSAAEEPICNGTSQEISTIPAGADVTFGIGLPSDSLLPYTFTFAYVADPPETTPTAP